ncbi:MAG: hypothetical protein SGARI_000670, partial [Bacillariaceae sp.]
MDPSSPPPRDDKEPDAVMAADLLSSQNTEISFSLSSEEVEASRQQSQLTNNSSASEDMEDVEASRQQSQLSTSSLEDMEVVDATQQSQLTNSSSEDMEEAEPSQQSQLVASSLEMDGVKPSQQSQLTNSSLEMEEVDGSQQSSLEMEEVDGSQQSSLEMEEVDGSQQSQLTTNSSSSSSLGSMLPDASSVAVEDQKPAASPTVSPPAVVADASTSAAISTDAKSLEDIKNEHDRDDTAMLEKETKDRMVQLFDYVHVAEHDLRNPPHFCRDIGEKPSKEVLEDHFFASSEMSMPAASPDRPSSDLGISYLKSKKNHELKSIMTQYGLPTKGLTNKDDFVRAICEYRKHLDGSKKGADVPEERNGNEVIMTSYQFPELFDCEAQHHGINAAAKSPSDRYVLFVLKPPAAAVAEKPNVSKAHEDVPRYLDHLKKKHPDRFSARGKNRNDMVPLLKRSDKTKDAEAVNDFIESAVRFAEIEKDSKKAEIREKLLKYQNKPEINFLLGLGHVRFWTSGNKYERNGDILVWAAEGATLSTNWEVERAIIGEETNQDNLNELRRMAREETARS